MDSSKITSHPNPREKANLLSVLLWWWPIGIFKKGYRKELEIDDLYDALKTDQSSYLGDRLEKRWYIELENSKKNHTKPSLLKTIFRTFWWEYFLLGCIQVLGEFIIRLGTPILLGALLQYFKPNQVSTTYEAALYYAAGISLATWINVITLNQAIFGAFHIGGRIRIAVCSVVYRKALRLSKTALGETAPGKIVNLVASDVNRFDLVSIFIHFIWSAPLSALIIAYFLYTEAQVAGLIGIAAVFVVVPIQAYAGKLSSRFRLQTAIKTDERVRLMDEIISGVQVIKMYAWEKPFCALVEMARKLELRVVRKSSYIRGIYMTFNIFTTRMALYCTLVSMLMFGQQLTADKVFVFSSYFNILAHTMSGMFVRGFAEIAECIVAVRRLQSFLLRDEFRSGNVINVTKLTHSNGISIDSDKESINMFKQDLPFIDDDDVDERKRQTVSTHVKESLRMPVQENNTSDINKSWAVKLESFTAKWDNDQTEYTLDNLNLQVEKGKLYVIVGMVGAGKSSLFSAILGEINALQGNVKIKGGVSYASQEPWVFGASVRQNILFGETYDRQRYHRVVKACALLKDFGQLPHGDQTIVGERGSSLSGGQKARINLARAVYRRADIYLLDDPLSAVDAHVGKHLFEECLLGYLAGKTRILATHQLQYIKDCDAIILLDQGKMQFFKDHRELLTYHPEYQSLLAAEISGETSDDSSFEKSTIRKRRFSSSSNKSRTPDASGVDSDADEEDDGSGNLNNLEGTSRGVIEGSIYMKYFRAATNVFVIFIMAFLFILTQCLASLNDLFIPILVTAEESRYYYATANLSITETRVIMDKDDILPVNTYVYIYTAIVVSVFVVGITRSFVFYTVCMSASQRLHDMVFGALIRTGMRFFDTNPSGRILNRFSKDMGAIDELLPKAMLDAGQFILIMIGSLVVACIVSPIFLVPILIISAIFYWIRKVYLKTSKNIKRLEGITRSPVFTHLNATLNGLSTIRAYQAQTILKREFDRFQDIHTSTWYMFIATSTAFGFSLDVFCFIFTTLVAFSFLLLKEHFSGGQVGLTITQVMSMAGMIQWGMRQGAEVANQLMSVERVLEYTELPSEPNLRDTRNLGKTTKKKQQDLVVCLVEPPQDWPKLGAVEFKDVYLRYSEDDAPVLKGLSFYIQPFEKVGIVGRTGAGKSSLITALFRLAKVEGVIEIDGINTGTIALEDLRTNISIIPQDPVLFSGTLKRNLDPFNEFSDAALWEALNEVELKEAVISAGNGLDGRVLDRGANYSVGQRQLVCLARAILRNNRVLMLDEATANVDPQTDSLIQHTIRTKFASCTVLTVAHRLNTIMDSDKVLVMDKGRMVEFDHPHILLEKDRGHFTSLVKETGRAMYEQLARVARESYYLKHGISLNSTL